MEEKTKPYPENKSKTKPRKAKEVCYFKCSFQLVISLNLTVSTRKHTKNGFRHFFRSLVTCKRKNVKGPVIVLSRNFYDDC